MCQINYGVQPQTELLLNQPVGPRTSYSDLLAWLLLSVGAGANYLEIGVSVGKNLHQVASNVHAFGTSNVALLALDLEPFNPMLLGLYPSRKRLAVWPSPATIDGGGGEHSLKTDALSTVDEHSTPAARSGDVRLFYISADLKTRGAWEAVQTHVAPRIAEWHAGERMADSQASAPSAFVLDLIFSDAWHSAEAITWELGQLMQRKWIGRRTILVWDDLNSRSMQVGFGQICIALRASHPAVVPDDAGGSSDTIDCTLSAVQPGWVASNSSDLIGVIGPTRVLADFGLHLVLPSVLRMEDFGYTL